MFFYARNFEVSSKLNANVDIVELKFEMSNIQYLISNGFSSTIQQYYNNGFFPCL